MLHEGRGCGNPGAELNRLIFRYDSTPHFPDLVSFPHHKHMPDDVIDSDRPDIELVVKEAMEASG
jgi:hypothetical protein